MGRPKGFLAQVRCHFAEARESRVHPERDDKALNLASWNGLMLAAFAEVARMLEEVLVLGAPGWLTLFTSLA